MNINQHWENIYQNKSDSEVSWYQEIPHTSLKLLSQLDLPLYEPIIDVGGGNSNLARELYAKGYRDITVLDISQAVINRKKEELGEVADHIQWSVGDVLDLHQSKTYRIWHDRAVFHFFTDLVDIQQYISIVDNHVAQNGYVILSTFSKNGPEKCSGLTVSRYSIDDLNGLFSDRFHLIKGFEDVHTTPFGTDQKFAHVVLKKIKIGL